MPIGQPGFEKDFSSVDPCIARSRVCTLWHSTSGRCDPPRRCAPCVATGRSSVTDDGSSKHTVSGTHRSGFVALYVARAKRPSRCRPIGRRRRGSTASIGGNKPGSCCADPAVAGNDRFHTSPMHQILHLRRGKSKADIVRDPDPLCIDKLWFQNVTDFAEVFIPRVAR